MTDLPRIRPEPGAALLDLFEEALPQVYGYLVARTGSPALAEDLTSETFLAAVVAVRQQPVAPIRTPWLIATARHKLVDHWRRTEREERRLRLMRGGYNDREDPWEAELDALVAREVLQKLGAHHRAALTLRYLDGLPVPEVAEHLDRTVHATEALLVRARAAFRAAYEQHQGFDGKEGDQ